MNEEDLKQRLKDASEEFERIETSILLMGKDKGWTPEIYTPVTIMLYATASKELGISFERAVEFAAKVVAKVYEVDLVAVQSEDAEEDEGEEDDDAPKFHRGNKTKH